MKYLMYGSMVMVVLLCAVIVILLWRELTSRDRSAFSDLLAFLSILGVFASMALYALLSAFGVWAIP